MMLNKRRRWLHSSRVKLPLANMSASRFLVSTCLIWIWWSKWILSNNQKSAAVWVLDTCLIDGLLPFMTILITASSSSKMYNWASNEDRTLPTRARDAHFFSCAHVQERIINAHALAQECVDCLSLRVHQKSSVRLMRTLLGVPDPFPSFPSTPTVTPTGGNECKYLGRSTGRSTVRPNGWAGASSEVMSPRASSKSAVSTRRSTSPRERTASTLTSMTSPPQLLHLRSRRPWKWNSWLHHCSLRSEKWVLTSSVSLIFGKQRRGAASSSQHLQVC